MHKSVVAASLIFLLSACASPGGPTPEELARASQINVASEATATAAALTIQNRIAESTAVAPATATVRAARVSSDVALSQATAVVATARAGSDVSSAEAKPTKDWLWFFVLMSIVLALGLMLYWIGRMFRRASMRYGKTATGIVGVDESGRLFNSSTMVESTITAQTNQADLLFQLGRIQHYLMTGRVLPLPEAQKPLLTDGDATAAQRTQVAVTARTGDALAAAMDSKISERERLERMALLRGRQSKSSDNILGSFGAPTLAVPAESQGQTNVTVIRPTESDPYLQLIAGTYGVPAKALAERAQSAQDHATIIEQAQVNRSSV